jgi:hypothetical protein
MLAFHHLIISSATCPGYIWLEPAFSVILWFWNPVILRSWVCQNSWESSCLWDPEILVWPSFWDPGILGSYDPGCVRMLGNEASSRCCRTGCGVCAQGPYQHRALIKQGRIFFICHVLSANLILFISYNPPPPKSQFAVLMVWMDAANSFSWKIVDVLLRCAKWIISPE